MAQPHRSLTDRAKRLGDDVLETGRNVWLASKGALALAEEGSRGIYERLLDKGRESAESGRFGAGSTAGIASDRVKRLFRKVEHGLRGTVGATLKRAGIPSREDIRALSERVEQLNRKVDALDRRDEG